MTRDTNNPLRDPTEALQERLAARLLFERARHARARADVAAAGSNRARLGTSNPDIRSVSAEKAVAWPPREEP
jgi:hypothetical protein